MKVGTTFVRLKSDILINSLTKLGIVEFLSYMKMLNYLLKYEAIVFLLLQIVFPCIPDLFKSNQPRQKIKYFVYLY